MGHDTGQCALHLGGAHTPAKARQRHSGGGTKRIGTLSRASILGSYCTLLQQNCGAVRHIVWKGLGFELRNLAKSPRYGRYRHEKHLASRSGQVWALPRTYQAGCAGCGLAAGRCGTVAAKPRIDNLTQ